MLAQRIFEQACSYLSQTAAESTDAATYAPMWINACVREAFELENSLRRFNNVAQLPVAPDIISLEDDVPYYDDICLLAIPYGVASYMQTDDDNDYRAQDFRARFISALNDMRKTRFVKVRDIFAKTNDT